MNSAKQGTLRELLKASRPIVADGAMSTSLYEKGFYINRSFEELSVTEPNAVREVVRGFKRAGAQLLHTNTFNATRPKLLKYGLQDQLENIIRSSTRITKDVADGDAFTIGLIGPLGLLIEPLGPTSASEAEDLFFEIARIFEEEGVDGFAINSLHDLNELKCAIRAVRRASNKPLMVSIGIHENSRTSHGYTLADFVRLVESEAAENEKVDAVGVCGEVGPSNTLTAIETLRDLTTLPIIALPNAGLPRYVNDQYIYLCNPDYLAKYAKRFAQAGATIIGGNSGVFDQHIQAVANALRMVQSSLQPRETKNLPPHIAPLSAKPVEPTPIEMCSKLGRFLNEKKTVISVELVPPSLQEFDKFNERCAELRQGGIEFVNIPDGARAMARISSLHLAQHVFKNHGLEPIPHFTCRDRNLIGLQSDLLGAHIAGIRNLLLVTGDPPKLGNNPGASAVYDVDAIGLTHIVSRLNHSLDIGGAALKRHTEFVIGVALNPTARNVDLEVSRFKYKMEAGCHYAITQPIYNLETYLRFMEQVGPVNTPIIMGIWPLVSLRNAEFLKYEVPGVDVPDWVIDTMKKAGDNKEDAIKYGLEIAMKTMEQAKKHVAGFQVSAPFNKVQIAIDAIRGAT